MDVLGRCALPSHLKDTQLSTPFTATILGAPRIGPNRELKRAVERYWAGRIDRAALEEIAAGLRRDTLSSLAQAGLDSVPVNTFSYYDQVLDTAVLLGALPARVRGVADDLDRYFAAARGTADIAPLEMTKWFDTNYHYLVPEIGPDTAFTLHPEKVLAELKEARTQGVSARPVIVGPLTFLALSKAVDGAGAPIERLGELLAEPVPADASGPGGPSGPAARAVAILRDRRGLGGEELGLGNRNALENLSTTQSVVIDEPENGVLYAVNCTNYVSGTINFRLSA